MRRLLNKVTVILLALVFVGTLGLSCGGGDDEEKVTITIGEMTDLTGAASSAVASIHYGLVDLVRYYNDEGLIPGVKLRLVTWNTHLDPARTIPGYDWLRQRGADLIVSLITQDAVMLKPFADRDKFPIFSQTTNQVMMEPPGWVFCLSSRADHMIVTLLKWVSEKHWDYDHGTPKIGFVAWDDPSGREIEQGMKTYSQAHPDRFDYVRGFLPPMGTAFFSAEVEGLKNCDYVCAYSVSGISFLQQYLAKGYRTTVLDPAVFPSFQGYLLDRVGWQAVDGMLSVISSLTWTETEPHAMQDLARQLLQRYRRGQAEDFIREGTGYFSAGVVSNVAVLDILQNAIGAVDGAENLSSQAIYDAAVGYKIGGTLWQGYPEWGFGQTKRYLYDDARIYEWKAAEEDIVRVQDWIPLVTGW
ncbi:MAG: ABC transporter substrate-binding protein [Chloroflexi bacterium]|nr:ABC transporter substrate-binding protein [Chloroflexota bacterium]